MIILLRFVNPTTVPVHKYSTACPGHGLESISSLDDFSGDSPGHAGFPYSAHCNGQARWGRTNGFMQTVKRLDFFNNRNRSQSKTTIVYNNEDTFEETLFKFTFHSFDAQYDKMCSRCSQANPTIQERSTKTNFRTEST